MTYLDLARSALIRREQSEKRPSSTTAGQNQAVSAGEKSEICEKSPDPDSPKLLLAEDAERLKVQILAAVTVAPADFDRQRYAALLDRWNTYEAMSAGPIDEGEVA